jgi:CheY-like chemotaxis protein
VGVHSEGLGRGSEFAVRLPLAPAASAASLPTSGGEPAPMIPRRVLIVDDNEDGAESLAMMLEFAGHTTYKAYDGPEAIESARRLSPDAVLLDIGLPGMSGYEVCRRIRSEPWGKDLVLVALTGWGQQEDRELSREAGFDSHMVKPVDLDALLGFLNNVVASHQSPVPSQS